MYDFTSKQDFEAWKSEIPAKTQQLRRHLDIGLAEIDGDSVKRLSEWVLAGFSDIASLKRDEVLWDRLACFFGEYYRIKLDSQWSIELDEADKDNVYFRKPLVLCDPPPPLCPMHAVTMMVSRKNPNFMLESVTKRLRQKP